MLHIDNYQGPGMLRRQGARVLAIEVRLRGCSEPDGITRAA